MMNVLLNYNFCRYFSFDCVQPNCLVYRHYLSCESVCVVVYVFFAYFEYFLDTSYLVIDLMNVLWHLFYVLHWSQANACVVYSQNDISGLLCLGMLTFLEAEHRYDCVANAYATVLPNYD